MQDMIALQKKALDDLEELRKVIKSDIHATIVKGKLLKEIRDTQEFKLLGDGGYQTFESFLAQETGMSRAYAWQHIQIYEYYVLEMGIPMEQLLEFKSIQTMLTCIGAINKYALQGQEALDLIEKAKVLSHSDFKKELMILEGVPESVIEQRAQEQQQARALPTVEQEDLRQEFMKPIIKRHDFCSKWQIEFYENQVCMCNGRPHVINLTKEGGMT